MPEGDTIYRAAVAMSAVLVDQRVTDVRTSAAQVLNRDVRRLVGQEISHVQARGKHLLHWFRPSGLALHTHLRMTGAWHTYAEGERWRQEAHLARVILTVEGGDHAVAFAMPTIQLLTADEVKHHPALSRLGPDPLADGPRTRFDLEAAVQRLAAYPDDPIGVGLLNQQVMAGVGNVYKNDVLFIHAVDPWTPVAEIPLEQRRALLATAAGLLQANIAHGRSGRITTKPPLQVARSADVAARGDQLLVYGKANRACPRCPGTIRCEPQGEHQRLTYWCPRCQGPGPKR